MTFEKGLFTFGRIGEAVYHMLVPGIASNKSQFLISELGCLSKDLLLPFAPLNSHNRFITPLVSFLFALKDTQKCWKPIRSTILRTFLGYFLRSDVGVGRGKGKEYFFF